MRRHVVLLGFTVVVVLAAFVATLLSDDRPVLGLDLQGGVSIVLFPVEGSDLSTLGTAADIIRSRVDALGVAEPEVSVQGDTIVVDLPGVKDRERAEALIGQTAELRFRPVLDVLAPVIPETTTTTAGATTTTGGGGATTTTAAEATTPGEDAQSLGTSIDTRPVASVRAARPAQDATTSTPPTSAPPTSTLGATTTSAPSTTTTTLVPGTSCRDVVTPREGDLFEAQVTLPSKEAEEGCYVLGPAALSGRSVRTAKARYESAQGWLVDVEFRGDDFIEQVAVPYENQLVAIVLDGVVQSAPLINPGITGREVQISGSFTQGEANDLALVLRYGALPVQFDPDERTVRSVSPSLGRDQLRAGVIAGLIGLALVALYMILYYRLLGLVVWIGLGLTAMIFFSLVSYLSASSGLTLTLAGVTGLIVSVGVTVDSYVVYFERLKDEVRTGKTVRSSLDQGFRRAFRTIVAADLVSLLGATILYLLAEGSVRGFALFLGISTVIDLVLSYVFMHPLVALMARRPALVRLPGVGIAAGLDVPEARA